MGVSVSAVGRKSDNPAGVGKTVEDIVVFGVKQNCKILGSPVIEIKIFFSLSDR
jgi:hypothetical protein